MRVLDPGPEVVPAPTPARVERIDTREVRSSRVSCSFSAPPIDATLFWIELRVAWIFKRVSDDTSPWSSIFFSIPTRSWWTSFCSVETLLSRELTKDSVNSKPSSIFLEVRSSLSVFKSNNSWTWSFWDEFALSSVCIVSRRAFKFLSFSASEDEDFFGEREISLNLSTRRSTSLHWDWLTNSMTCHVSLDIKECEHYL